MNRANAMWWLWFYVPKSFLTHLHASILITTIICLLDQGTFPDGNVSQQGPPSLNVFPWSPSKDRTPGCGQQHSSSLSSPTPIAASPSWLHLSLFSPKPSYLLWFLSPPAPPTPETHLEASAWNSLPSFPLTNAWLSFRSQASFKVVMFTPLITHIAFCLSFVAKLNPGSTGHLWVFD